jgi:transposase
MRSTTPLNQCERERIYQGWLQNKSIAEIAQELERSEAVVRKWWRRIRDTGAPGLLPRKRGRPAHGTLSTIAPAVSSAALALKRQHRRWGANRVLTELKKEPHFAQQRLPSPSRLAVYFHQQCPDCLSLYQARRAPAPAPPRPTAVHEIWQLDSQEGIKLADRTIATICTIRDPFGAAILASCAFAVTTAKHWRKLTVEEIQQVLRAAFTEWQTLPDSLQTDNELVLAGSALDPFPSRLTLWLAGLTLWHSFIRPHTPTDQPQIERTHRTLQDLALDESGRTDLLTLQQALDRERQTYNTCFPSRASDCAGRPPLLAHPELLRARRPYQPDQEWRLFSLERVYDFLAGFAPFERKVSSIGRVSLGRCLYSLGRSQAGKTVWASFDAHTGEWVFQLKLTEREHEQMLAIARRKAQRLDVATLTGLIEPSQDAPPLMPLQLTLPYLVPH